MRKRNWNKKFAINLHITFLIPSINSTVNSNRCDAWLLANKQNKRKQKKNKRECMILNLHCSACHDKITMLKLKSITTKECRKIVPRNQSVWCRCLYECSAQQYLSQLNYSSFSSIFWLTIGTEKFEKESYCDKQNDVCTSSESQSCHLKRTK